MDDIPYGYCQCGCGGKTHAAKWDQPNRGYLKGEYRRYLPNHHHRKYHTESEKKRGDKASQQKAKARNRALVDKLRAATVCAKCGAQPIDWHNPEHQANPLHRISWLGSTAASVQKILSEIARCTPLCRRCHMTEDGRLEKLAAAREAYWQKRRPSAS